MGDRMHIEVPSPDEMVRRMEKINKTQIKRGKPLKKSKVNQVIELDSFIGEQLGFTSDKFIGYLWLYDKDIKISTIESKHPGKGNFNRLMQTILDFGYNIRIPAPMDIMSLIVRKKGFHCKMVYDEVIGEDIEVWTKRCVGKCQKKRKNLKLNISTSNGIAKKTNSQ